MEVYKIAFMPSNNQTDGAYYFPMTFSWPDAHDWFNGPVRLVDPYGGLGVNVDMKSQTSYSLPESLSIRKLIIKTGVDTALAVPPAVLTEKAEPISTVSSRLNGLVNPNGSATDVWFEWGTTTAYGSETTPQSLSTGSSTVPVSDDLSGLAENSTYYYRVVGKNANGTMYGPPQAFTPHSVTAVAEHPSRPMISALYQNFPNPFNPTTNFKYVVDEGGTVTLKVFDILGKEVATLVDAYRHPGEYTVSWSAANLASGMYYYRFETGKFISVKKLMIVK
jgi:hypothetical protein